MTEAAGAASALDIALAVAAAGWHVFPIKAGAKVPLTPNGFKDATTDATRIGRWAAEFPGCNWAVACGASDLLVVDADPRNGANPAAIASQLPRTLCASTGGGGFHWYFKGARRVPAHIAPGVDLKSEGGYVLLPGSFTTGPYAWADVTAVAPVPPAVLNAIAAAPAARVPSECDDLPPGLQLDATWAAEASAEVATLPAAKRGDGGTPLLRAAAVAIRGWLLDLDTADAVLRAAWCPRCEPPWTFDDPGDERNWWHTLERARDIGDVEWGSRRPLVGLDAAASPADVVVRQVQREDGIGVPVARAATIDASGLRLAPTGWPWVLRKGQWCWLHDLEDARYGQPIEKSDLRLQIKRTHGKVIALVKRDEDKRAELTPAEFEDLYEHRVRELKATYLARANTWDPASATLTMAALRWAPLDARQHADVDAWLRALGGSRYEALAQWLASCVALKRPAPALYLHGELKVGKSLLARGIARLWQTEPAPFAEALDSFNEATATCPLMYADEGFPDKMSFNIFREMVTSPARRVNEKYKPKYAIEGCVRIILSTNNSQALRYQRTGVLTSQDMHAVADRLLVIHAGAEARDVLKGLNASSFVDENKLAEHVWWLADTVELEPAHERMCAKSGDAGEVLDALQAARYPLQLKAIADGKPAAGVFIDADAVWVNSQLLHKAAKAVAFAAHEAEPREHDTRDFVAAFVDGKHRKFRLPGSNEDSTPLWWHPLSLTRLKALLERAEV